MKSYGPPGGSTSHEHHREEYVDENAAFEHNQHCAELLDESGRISTLTTIQIHGELGPDLARGSTSTPGHGVPAPRVVEGIGPERPHWQSRRVSFRGIGHRPQNGHAVASRPTLSPFVCRRRASDLSASDTHTT